LTSYVVFAFVDVVVLVVCSWRYRRIVVMVSIVTKTIWRILSKTVVELDVLASGGQRYGMMWCVVEVAYSKETRERERVIE
jgi:hypothetical protein